MDSKNEASGMEIKKSKALLKLSRTPIYCPISSCRKLIGATATLSHFFQYHFRDFDRKTVVSGETSKIIVDLNNLKFMDTTCLGLLTYEGINKTLAGQPAVRGICLQSTALPSEHKKLAGHLPIFIMVCLTGLPAMVEGGEKMLKHFDIRDKKKHVLVFWLTSMETTKPIHYTLSVHNKSMAISHSSVMTLRSLSETQNVTEFSPSGSNSLVLIGAEISNITGNYKEQISLETIIHEY